MRTFSLFIVLAALAIAPLATQAQARGNGYGYGNGCGGQAARCANVNGQAQGAVNCPAYGQGVGYGRGMGYGQGNGYGPGMMRGVSWNAPAGAPSQSGK